MERLRWLCIGNWITVSVSVDREGGVKEERELGKQWGSHWDLRRKKPAKNTY